MYDLVIQNGLLVTDTEIAPTDLAVADGKVAALLAIGSGARGRRVIDASGCYLLPGIIDAHTHYQFSYPGMEPLEDDFEKASIAAAHGGVTSFIDFAWQRKGQLPIDALRRRQREADGSVVIDYSLHMWLSDVTDAALDNLAQVVEAGVTSFKGFTCFKAMGVQLNDGELYRLMKRAAELGALTCIHAENGDIIDACTAGLLAQGQRSVRYFPRSRPNFTEGEAIARAVRISAEAQAGLYIVHMSTAEGTELVAQARAEGLPVYAEARLPYLVLTEDRYAQEDGAKYVMAPPLRRQADVNALWEGLFGAAVSTVASDHCAMPYAIKSRHRDEFDKVPAGVPGSEALLPILYDQGVKRGRIQLPQVVNALSMAPARIFGLYPRKGALLPGSDADVVLFDPRKKVTLSGDTFHTPCDYSIYEGMEVEGYPIMTLLRGEPIVEGGTFRGKKGGGTFLKRTSPGVILQRPC